MHVVLDATIAKRVSCLPQSYRQYMHMHMYMHLDMYMSMSMHMYSPILLHTLCPSAISMDVMHVTTFS